jgi:predicted lipoprotein with Yx(FWY)xxD motif
MTDSRRITFLTSIALVLPAALAVAACGGSATASPASPKTSNGQAATVAVANSGLGKILVDSHGRALYLFKADVGTKSACTGACVAAWPPLRTAGRPTVGSGANSSLVSTTARSDGEPEVTYNGHPVYRFAGDTAPGDVNGEGLTAFGGEWLALSPAGNEVTNQPSSSGSAGGY